MIEQEWAECADPQAMLDFMFERASRRKTELYTSGCYRTVWHLLTDERLRNVMNVRDRYFDGLATNDELGLAIKAAADVPNHVWQDAWNSIGLQRQVEILRDLFGNPFRPATIDPAILTWHDGTVSCLAQAIYDDRQMPAVTFDPALMNILADALLDAGCENEDIITHCRSDKAHVRGYWLVDLLLGKE